MIIKTDLLKLIEVDELGINFINFFYPNGIDSNIILDLDYHPHLELVLQKLNDVIYYDPKDVDNYNIIIGNTKYIIKENRLSRIETPNIHTQYGYYNNHIVITNSEGFIEYRNYHDNKLTSISNKYYNENYYYDNDKLVRVKRSTNISDICTLYYYRDNKLSDIKINNGKYRKFINYDHKAKTIRTIDYTASMYNDVLNERRNYHASMTNGVLNVHRYV